MHNLITKILISLHKIQRIGHVRNQDTESRLQLQWRPYSKEVKLQTT